ncbi:MAG TPA: hypothetical protein VE907_15665 [Gammaproteobacteria bacterium]|nr:hypothetical protein [Gammaproteobacteria bacterium]
MTAAKPVVDVVSCAQRREVEVRLPWRNPDRASLALALESLPEAEHVLVYVAGVAEPVLVWRKRANGQWRGHLRGTPDSAEIAP